MILSSRYPSLLLSSLPWRGDEVVLYTRYSVSIPTSNCILIMICVRSWKSSIIKSLFIFSSFSLDTPDHRAKMNQEITMHLRFFILSNNKKINCHYYFSIAKCILMNANFITNLSILFLDYYKIKTIYFLKPMNKK